MDAAVKEAAGDEAAQGGGRAVVRRLGGHEDGPVGEVAVLVVDFVRGYDYAGELVCI